MQREAEETEDREAHVLIGLRGHRACKRHLQIIHTEQRGKSKHILDLCTTPEDVVQCKELWDARWSSVYPEYLQYVDDLWKSYTERRERWLKS